MRCTRARFPVAAVAMAALVGCNRLFGTNLDRADLERMGARLGSDVPFFAAAGADKNGTGRGIGTSFAINAMLKALTGVEAHVLGKPSLDALQVAKARMGLAPDAPIAVVGDDPQLEARMANLGGAYSVGVTTGIYDEDAFKSREDPLERPKLLLSGIDQLHARLREGA